MPGDGENEAADISVIPLAAIERVEVVTDGSSAVYGTDAVAGVVNFILRKDYNGLEASAYYGGATEGGGEQQVYSLLGGVVADRWHLLMSAEYEHDDPITAAERTFTAGYYGLGTLTGAETKKTIFVSGGINITDNISLSIDALYNDREAGQVSAYLPYDTINIQSDSPIANLASTLEFKLPKGWNLTLVGTGAPSITTYNSQETAGASLLLNSTKYRNDVNSLEFTASGNALALPSGNLRMAIGGGYRHEGFELSSSAYASEDIRASRDVSYLYGEAIVPLVPASVSRIGMQQLEVGASGRYEHYSDFGDTANPKVGVRYVPFAGLGLRAAWGTSFKAPTFYQMYEPNEVLLIAAHYYGGTGNTLEVSGGNPNLKPERSENWTMGFDWSPPKLKSLVISATYFNIDYTNRIVVPFNNLNDHTFLTSPDDASFVTLNPSQALDNSIIAGANPFYNLVSGPLDTSMIKSIIYATFNNAEAQRDSGVDLSYREAFQTGIGDVKTFASAIWNHLTQQLVAGEGVQTLSGTIFNVPKFRARGGASWSKYGLTANAILNYTSSETDAFVTPSKKVASWTTVDMNLAYKFPDADGIKRGLSFTLSATNIFNKAPPYAASTEVAYPGINYDSLNASPIGRFVAVKLTKKW